MTNANIDPIKAPAEDVLSKWFDGVKSKYRAPEYRKIAYVKLQAEDVADPSSVTDDAVRAEFEKRKDSFTTPATRIDRAAYLRQQGSRQRRRRRAEDRHDV